MRLIRLVPLGLAATALGALALGGGGTAASASTPAGGAVKFIVLPGTTGNSSAIVVTGVIGGRGSVSDVDKNGTPDPNGRFAKVSLPQGTFEVNLTALDTKAGKASYPINHQSCTAEGSVTASVTDLDGTGLYKGMTGTQTVTETVAFTMPRYTTGKDKGECNGSQAVTLELVTGSGHVSFP